MFKRKLLVIFLVGIVIFKGFAKPDILSQAEEFYRYELYSDAALLFKQAYLKEKKDKIKKGEIAFKLAECYRKTHYYKVALTWYIKAETFNPSNNLTTFKLHAEDLKQMDLYTEAIEVYKKCKELDPSDASIDEQVALCNEAIDWINNPHTRFQVDIFKPANTKYNDFCPMPLKKTELYFTSDRLEAKGKKASYGRSGQKYSDIFAINRSMVGKNLGPWSSKLVLLNGTINSVHNEGTPCFDPKGNVMYYTQCNGKSDSKRGDSIKNCVLMMSKKKTGDKGVEWGDDEILSFCNDSNTMYGQPALSPDGTRMVFAMGSRLGDRQKDLYFTTYVKRSKTWSDPVSLGEAINTTSGDEMYPYFFNDTTLYFASNGLPGMGGLDIFRVYGTGTSWGKPYNLRAPLNSGSDDFAIAFNEDENTGYFTSNRTLNTGDDIWAFKLNPFEHTLSGIVYDKKSMKRLKNADVYLEAPGKTPIKVSTNDTGYYFYKLDKETDYNVQAKKKRYFNSDIEDVTTMGLEYSYNFKRDLYLLNTDIPIEIPGILYDLDQATLRPESKRALDSLIGIMNEYPYITVELGAHTDCRASFAYNDSLSEARAKSVVDYLVDHNVDRERMTPKGYGERMLKNNCACEPNDVGPGADCTEAEHQINRRTEIRVLTYDYVPKQK